MTDRALDDRYSLECLVMMPIHISGKEVEYGHVHQVKKSSARVIWWGVPDLEYIEMVLLGNLCDPRNI